MLFQKWIQNIPETIFTPHQLIKWFFQRKINKNANTNESKSSNKNYESIMRQKIEEKIKKEEQLTLEEEIFLFQDTQNKNQLSFINNIFNKTIFAELLNTYESKNVKVCSSFYEDLELFQNYNDSNDSKSIKNLTVFDKINTTKTQFGNIFFQFLLKNPIHNIPDLINRQNNLLIYNSNNTNFKKEVEQLHDLESDILWFYQEIDQYRKNIYDSIYFHYPYIGPINHFLNKNSPILLILQTYKLLISPFVTIFTPIVSILVPIVLWKMTGSKIPFSVLWNLIIKVVFKTMWSSKSYSTIFATLFSFGLWFFFYFQTIYSVITIARQTHRIISIIHKKMHSLYKFIQIVIKIREDCRQINLSPYPFGGGSEEQGKDKSKELDKNINYFRELLKHHVFADDKCKFFNHKGAILKNYYLFLQNKEKMLPIFHFIAEMDTLQNIDHLYRNIGYSIVKYNDPAKSFRINMKKMWHPFFEREKVVTNTLKMKKERMRIITGPNAAGKSTFIKSIMLNILLANTIGISPSTKMEISPIHYMYTYLHIPDIKGKQSLFQAEMIRNKEFLEHLNKEKNSIGGKNTFIIMDELFSSTNYFEGVSSAYSILKKISEYSNCKAIITTHFHELMKLEKETKKNIRNYYFDIREIYNQENNEKQEKQIIYTYKMKKGENKKRIAIDLLKHENFDSDIIETARRVYDREFGQNN